MEEWQLGKDVTTIYVDSVMGYLLLCSNEWFSGGCGLSWGFCHWTMEKVPDSTVKGWYLGRPCGCHG